MGTSRSGFTIVELLVVIVVIAILAAITIVAYAGIQDRARTAVVQSDLQQTRKQIEVFRTTSSDESYPTGVECPGNPAAGTACLTHNANTTLQYTYNSTAKTYCVSIIFGNIGQSITQTGVIQPQVCEGHTPPASGGSGPVVGWSDVALGSTHSCGIYNAAIYCWGSSGSGVLANNDATGSAFTTPQAAITSGALSGKVPTSLASSSYGVCAVASGEAYCWGIGTTFRLGNGTSANSPVAVLATGALTGRTVVSVGASYSNSCAIADGRPYCWGNGTSGRNGDNATANRTTPVAVTYSGVLNGLTLTSIATASPSSTSDGHSCTLATNGQVYCWGVGASGRLGNNATTNSSVPVAVNVSGVLSGKTVTKITAGGNFSCAMTSEGRAYCWGANNYGQLGNSSTTTSSVPVAVTTSGVLSGKTITDISSGEEHTCVVADGLPYCWGTGYNGRLGHGSSPAMSTSPVAVTANGALAGKTVTKVAAGNLHSCAITSDKQLYCWGGNIAGQLGEGTTNSTTDPVKVQNP